MKIIFLLGCISLFACTHTKLPIDMRSLKETGYNGVKISPVQAQKNEILGNVSARVKSFWFSDCNELFDEAMVEITDQAKLFGANEIQSFRGRGTFRKFINPVCRTNIGMSLLILPLFLPIQKSVTVQGHAVFIEETGSNDIH